MQVSESTKVPVWGGAVRRGPAPGRPELMAAWEATAGHGPAPQKNITPIDAAAGGKKPQLI